MRRTSLARKKITISSSSVNSAAMAEGWKNPACSQEGAAWKASVDEMNQYTQFKSYYQKHICDPI
jgi:hypothetical protein